MATWRIELVTNDVQCNEVEIDAILVEKPDYQTLIIDGEKWELPDICGMSFARVERIDV
jgi:hypothetical protein